MPAHKFPPSTILVPTDFGPASDVALAFAKMMREQYKAAIKVIHAHHFELPPYFSGGQMKVLTRELQKARKAAAELLQKQCESKLGAEVNVSVAEKPPADAILDASAEARVDLIIMGTHGHRGAERLWLGSVAGQVIRLSKVPVLAVNKTITPGPFREILCPVNATPTGQEALRYAAMIAALSHAGLTVLNAFEGDEPPVGCGAAGDEIRKHCEVREISMRGNAARAILHTAHENKSSLIVMGAEWKSSPLGELFSSTTEQVMQHATTPLLVVPRA
jgi:nucleotide-binding universal stress UspA family protein